MRAVVGSNEPTLRGDRYHLPVRDRLVSLLCFDCLDLVEPAKVAFFAREACQQEGGGHLLGERIANHPAAHYADIGVVMLDGLMGRVRVVRQNGSNALDLVGGDRRPCP